MMLSALFRFRNELPDPSAKAKFLQYKRDPDRYEDIKY